jgi:hypothetical protein
MILMIPPGGPVPRHVGSHRQVAVGRGTPNDSNKLDNHPNSLNPETHDSSCFLGVSDGGGGGAAAGP